LGRGVHLRRLAGRRLGAVTEAAGEVLSVSIRRRALLMQSKRVDETSGRGLRRGAEVEDPDNLELSAIG
jgi:hypothetical protein